MYQFEHIYFAINNMYSIYNVKLDDHIIFIDDDDLLLELPVIDSPVVIGKQYLSPFVETNLHTLLQRKDITRTITNMSEIIIDFSGYICTCKLLLDFFNINKDIILNFRKTHEIDTKYKFYDEYVDYAVYTTDSIVFSDDKFIKILNNLIDLKFMDYLDKIDDSTKNNNPFILRRLCNIPNASITWLKDFNIKL